MKLLIEEYQYDTAKVVDVLDGLFTLQDIDNKISVSYVGYYYNPSEKVKDCVFVLPKVLIDEQGMVFGKYHPEDIIDLEANQKEEDETKRLKSYELKFLYEFAVWIHRAIVVYQNDHQDNGIVLRRQIESDGSGAKKKSNTLLDVILALIRFNKENRSFFTFVLKNIHSGFNKINWGKTISSTTAVVQGEEPVYLKPVNKKRQVNFDEELIVIFFSILNYIADRFGFRTEIPFGFKLITGNQFERYINGFGARRLRQIKYKYYSDIAVRLWDLCYAFFDKAYQIKMSVDKSEYLLVKSFHIVFEAIIEELIGDNDVPEGLKDQEDGKRVDHFYTHQGLVSNREENNDVYYIGDSKYYKIGRTPQNEAVYKQYTYARNVIQWNLNLFLAEDKDLTEKERKARDKDKNRFEKITIRDEITEGYNIIPNFFVSANIPSNEDGTANLIYDDITKEHEPQPRISRHFNNRLYDRDTLLLSHYDVNFLFVLALYARNNAGAKESYKATVRQKFRRSIQGMLEKHFKFYAIQAHPDVDGTEWIKANFKQMLGRTYRPFLNNDIYSVALDKDPKYKSENEALISSLKENFYMADCPLGSDPNKLINEERRKLGDVNSPAADKPQYLTTYIVKEERGEDGNKRITKQYELFSQHAAKGADYVLLRMPKYGELSNIKYLLPIVNSCIDGYYDIERLSLDTREKTFVEEGVSIPVTLPVMRMKLGDYHPLNIPWTKGVRPKMANQIWSQTKLDEYIRRNQGYMVEDGINPDLVEEPEADYGRPEEYEPDQVENIDDLLNE